MEYKCPETISHLLGILQYLLFICARAIQDPLPNLGKQSKRKACTLGDFLSIKHPLFKNK